MKPTLSFLKPRAETRCRLLPPRWRVKDQADACRSAALAFAWCTRASWGKRELARWLAGPYAKAIEATREPCPPRPSPQRSVGEESVQELLARSHEQIIRLLRGCSSWRSDESFARLMVDGVVVVGVIDHESAIGYAPVALPDMRLVDRVTSLFVADFLTRPADYARFRICDVCEGLVFGAGVEHAEACSRAQPGSGTRIAVGSPAAEEKRRITLVGLGGRAA